WTGCLPDAGEIEELVTSDHGQSSTDDRSEMATAVIWMACDGDIKCQGSFTQCNRTERAREDQTRSVRQSVSQSERRGFVRFESTQSIRTSILPYTISNTSSSHA